MFLILFLYILEKKFPILRLRASTAVNFHLLAPPLLVHKFILTYTTNLPNILHQKYFPYISHLGNSGCVKVPESWEVKSCED